VGLRKVNPPPRALSPWLVAALIAPVPCAVGQEPGSSRLERYGLQPAEPQAPPAAPGAGMFALPGPGGAPQRLTYQYSWGGEAEFIYRRDNDLNGRVRDNSTIAKPQVNGIFVYRPTDWMEATVELVLEKELAWHEESSVRLPSGTLERRPERPWSLLVDQGFVAFRQPGGRLSAALGRRNYEDDRHWLYDTSMDMAALGWREGRFRAEFSLGREVLRDAELLPRHHQGTDRIDTYMLYAEYRFTNNRVAAYQVIRNDRSSVANEGRPRLVGLRLQGAPTQALSYWGEMARLFGDDELRHRFKGRAFDIGATYRFPALPLAPNFTLAYAAATGDANPNDRENHEFRQSGLQSNEHRYGGIAMFNIYGEVLAPELSNLKVTSVGLGFRPAATASLDFIYHHYRLDEISDENRNWLLTALMNQVPGRQSRDVGRELDVVLGLRNMFGIRRLGVDLRMGWFSPGPAFLRNDGSRRTPNLQSADRGMTVVAKFFF
jgi:alginate production protein